MPSAIGTLYRVGPDGGGFNGSPVHMFVVKIVVRESALAVKCQTLRKRVGGPVNEEHRWGDPRR